MILKKKICTGFDNIEHEDYIYKNINGKKYCKSCTYKLQPPKPLKKMSEKGKFKLVLKQDEQQKDHKFYLDVWHSKFFTSELSDGNYYLQRTPFCQNCNRRLMTKGEQEDFPLTIWFHHLLPKAKFPKFRHKEWNIAVLCAHCHSQCETDIDKVPKIKQLRDELLIKIQNQ